MLRCTVLQQRQGVKIHDKQLLAYLCNVRTEEGQLFRLQFVEGGLDVHDE